VARAAPFQRSHPRASPRKPLAGTSGQVRSDEPRWQNVIDRTADPEGEVEGRMVPADGCVGLAHGVIPALHPRGILLAIKVRPARAHAQKYVAAMHEEC
jgi:hypothetical protein